jgi:hypothetical protein
LKLLQTTDLFFVVGSQRHEICSWPWWVLQAEPGLLVGFESRKEGRRKEGRKEGRKDLDFCSLSRQSDRLSTLVNLVSVFWAWVFLLEVWDYIA